MQLDLGIASTATAAATPRFLALCVPDLPLQRVLRSREAVAFDRQTRGPLAVEREGLVIACDPEARARGVRRGDQLAQARAACADLELVTADDDADRATLEAAAEALLALAPAVEVSRPDTLILDASGAHLLATNGSDGEAVLLQRALALANDLGLRCRAAVASGRAPSRALARYGGAPVPVPPDGVAGALARLPVDALGLEPRLAMRVEALGLRRVEDLARLPPETLAHRLGAEGLAAWRIAHGDDPSPLAPHVPRLLPVERLDFEAPVENAEALLFALKRLCDRAAARLAGRGLGATRLAIALCLDLVGEERLDIALASPSCLPSRWLLVVRERVSGLRLPAPVVALALTVVDAAPAPVEQLAIGDRPQQLMALETVLARLAGRLGDGALFAAARADRHRPEAAYEAGAFTAGRTRDASSPIERRRGRKARGRGAGSPDPSALAADATSPEQDELVRPTRLLQHPQPLVALGEGGRLAAVRLAGRTLQVLALSPAERLAGEWWSDPFDRDYHRARLEGLGECWIFRDVVDGRLWLHGFFD